MQKRNFHRGPRRGSTTRHFGPSTIRRTGKRGNKQYINPDRFVKVADPAAAGEYTPENSFAGFAIHPLLKNNIVVKGYTSPSEIQDKTIPLGLAGRDVVGVANTGTGKTAAFAVPILNKLLRDPSVLALVMTPTRELAIQIEGQCRIFAKNSGLSGALLIGGMPIGRQTTVLKHNPRIIIGTPGRIKDHINQGHLTLERCSIVVLDEVDRMLDMGFLPDMRLLLDQIPQPRQSFFFSATLSPEVNRLIATFTKDPVTVNVRQSETSDNVHQKVINYSGKIQRLDLLHEALIAAGMSKALIFGDTKYGVERLAKELTARGFNAASLHGGKNQGQRQRALDSFRNNGTNVLVATDVAARGIDVIDISHVINFDQPKTYDDYIHRIGRAGRAGKTGHAITFVESA